MTPEPALGRRFLCGAFAIWDGQSSAMKGKKEAITGVANGNDPARRGQDDGMFRPMIMKQAIEYNLAGFTRNLPNDVVTFTLQGDAERLTDAVSAIQEGTSSNIKVSTTRAMVDPALNTFTIYAWTSTTRNITTPYDLVFHLRPEIDSERRRPEETALRSLISVRVTNLNDCSVNRPDLHFLFA
jgi:acylphosphatase